MVSEHIKILATVCPSPFNPHREDIYFEPGLTVADILKQYAPAGLELNAHVWQGDKYIAREDWRTFIPTDTLSIRVVPAGGDDTGKNTLRIIGALAITAFTMGASAPVFAGWGFGGLAPWILGAGMGVAASWGLWHPIKTPDNIGSGDPVYSVTGSKNKANRYGVVPRAYGTIRMYPPLAAVPYTEIAGNEQYINVLYCFGYGDLTLDESSLKLGDDLVSDLEGVEYWLGSGFTNTGAESTVVPELYSNTVYETQLNDRLYYNEWVTHRTKTDKDANQISIDLTWPYGLYDYNGDNFESESVTIEYKYRKVGESDWLPNADSGVENLCPGLDEWTLGGTATYSAIDDEITLAAEDDYCESPFIRVNEASEFSFTANYNSTSASTYYTPQGGRYIEATYYYKDSDSGAIENSDDETLTADHAGYDTGGDESDTFTCTAGLRVRYVKLKIISKSPYTAASYKINTPEVTTAATYTTKQKTKSVYRKTLKWQIPDGEEGEYEVAVLRQTTYSDTSIVYLTALRTFTAESPVNMDDVAIMAMRVKASGSASGVVNEMSGTVTSNLPVYSGSWSDADTGNPAWVMCDILKGDANNNPVADARIDLTALQTWATYNTAGSREFNAVIDTPTTVYELLKAVAATGRASFTFDETQYSVIEDRAQTTVRQHFTPRNSWGFTGDKPFQNLPHALKVSFRNEDSDYIEDERIVYDDGYDADNATLFESVQYLGVTSPDRVWEDARYHIAAARLRPEIFTFNADFEHLVCQRGDLIAVTHDVPCWGLGSARIVSVTESGEELVIAIDSTFTMEDGKSYSVNFRYADNDVWFYTGTNYGIPIATVVGDNTSVTTAGWSDIFESPAAGDLIVFGIQNQARVMCLVKEITPSADMTAQIRCMEYNSAVYDADSGTIPDFDSKVTVREDLHRTPPCPSIYQVRSDETVMYRGIDGTYRTRMLIDLARVSDIAADLATVSDAINIIPHTLQTEYRVSGYDHPYISLPDVPAENMEVSITEVEDGESYDVRLRYVSEFGRASLWTELLDYEVIGKSSLPADISTINYKQPNIIEWAYDPPLDFRGFEVRYNDGTNTSWEQGTKAHDGFLTVARFDLGTYAAGTQTWLVKAIDTAGNYSDNAAYIVRNTGDPETSNIIVTYDIEADGYPGELTDCTVSTDLLADEETALFYGSDESLFYGDRPTLFYDSTYKAMTYVLPYFPSPSNAGSDLWFDMTTVNLRDVMYRRCEPDTDGSESFAGDLSDWTEDNDGTWAIASETLTAIHDSGGVYNQTLSLDTYDLPAIGTKCYIYFKVKSADVSDASFGTAFGGEYWYWTQTKHTTSSDGDTAESPTMTDDTYQQWLFEILEDATVNWYVDGAYIGSGERTSSSTTFRFLVRPDSVGPTTTTFDELRIWTPSASFVPWPGRITTDTDELYEFRFRSYAGANRGQITALDLNLDVDDIVEYQDDVAISSGSTRLTLVKTFTEITNITGTVQSYGAETAVSMKVLDKQCTAGAGNGPDIECYDASGSTTDGHVDLIIKGYYSE